ncbi:hypothetical protein PAGU2595_009900 [Lysobacter xanthus]
MRIEHEVARLPLRPVPAFVQAGVEEAEVVAVARGSAAHGGSIPPTPAGPRLNAAGAASTDRQPGRFTCIGAHAGIPEQHT